MGRRCTEITQAQPRAAGAPNPASAKRTTQSTRRPPTAAQCVERLGQRVRDIDGVEFGSVAFIGDADTTEWDFAFIEVDAEDVGP